MATVDCVRREGLWGLGMDGWVAPRTFEVVLRFHYCSIFTLWIMRGIFFEVVVWFFDALAKLF